MMRTSVGSLGESLVLRREDTETNLLSVLKALEIQKTLGSEPVLAALRHFPAQPARRADFPPGLAPRLVDVLEKKGYDGLYTHQRQAFDAVQDGRNITVRHAHRLRQDPLLQPARPRPHPEGPRRPGPLPLPDQGPGPGPARRAVRDGRGARGRHRHLHLRRRHAAGRAQGHPVASARRGHEPRHAAQGDPAPPHEVGEALREPALRDRGRAAQPPRRLRLARGQHLPAAAPALPLLRLRPAVPLLVRHHRQPEGAGRGADRPGDDAHRRERRPAGRAVLRDLQPAGREPPARHPPLRPGLRARRGAVLPEEGPADDRLRARRGWPPRCSSRT